MTIMHRNPIWQCNLCDHNEEMEKAGERQWEHPKGSAKLTFEGRFLHLCVDCKISLRDFLKIEQPEKRRPKGILRKARNESEYMTGKAIR